MVRKRVLIPSLAGYSMRLAMWPMESLVRESGRKNYQTQLKDEDLALSLWKLSQVCPLSMIYKGRSFFSA